MKRLSDSEQVDLGRWVLQGFESAKYLRLLACSICFLVFANNVGRILLCVILHLL